MNTVNTRLLKLLFKTQWALFVGPLIALTSVLAAQDVFDLWVDPDDETILLIGGVSLSLGVIFGVLLHVFEQLPSHREFMIHRGSSPRAYFLCKVSVGLAYASMPLFGSVLSSTWITQAISPNGIFVNDDGLLRLLALASTGLTGYGLGVWSTTVRAGRGTAVALIAIVAVAITLLSVMHVFGGRVEPVPSVATYFGFQFAATALFIVAAYFNFQRAFDPDRPVPIGSQVAHASVVGLAIAALLGIVVPQIQSQIARSASGYPVIARGADGQWGLFDLVEVDFRSTLIPVDAHHELAGEPLPVQPGYVLYTPGALSWLLNLDVTDRGPPVSSVRRGVQLGIAVQSLLHHPFERLLLERPSGQLAYYRIGHVNSTDACHEPLPRPDGRVFGPRTTVLGVSGGIGRSDFDRENAPIALGDPGDGTLWLVTFAVEPRGVAAIPLPNGDRFVAWKWKSRAIASARADSGDLSLVVVEGERGHYAFDAELRLAPTTSTGAEWGSAYAGSLALLRARAGEDLFHARVEVLADDGSVAFAHEYAPRRWRERVAHAACVVLGWLRPPLANSTPFTTDRFGMAMNGFVRPGHVVLFTLTLAALAVWMLRTRGACAKRIVAWAALVLLIGPGAFIAFLLLEREAAFVRVPREAAPEARLPHVVEDSVARA